MREAGDLARSSSRRALTHRIAALRHGLELARGLQSWWPLRCRPTSLPLVRHGRAPDRAARLVALRRPQHRAQNAQTAQRLGGDFANKLLSADDVIERHRYRGFRAVVFRLGDRAARSMTPARFPQDARTGSAWKSTNESRRRMGSGAPRHIVDRPSQQRQLCIIKDPSLLKPAARSFADLPGATAKATTNT